MSIKKDEMGSVYGHLTVVGSAGSLGGRLAWECRCSCGTLTTVRGTDLRMGNQTSCGCMKGSTIKHGQRRRSDRGNKTYICWYGMKNRCDNPNHPSAENYLERGITYVPEWAEFENFYRDMGDKPDGMTLERIDNDKGYGPDNCKWATYIEQSANKRPRSCYRKDKKCL